MEVKTFEIRDRGTFIPALAIQLMPTDERDRWLLARAGFGGTPQAQEEYVILVKLVDITANYDSYGWGPARTMGVAHRYILENWVNLENGQVVCVETILGERTTPKETEQLTRG